MKRSLPSPMLDIVLFNLFVNTCKKLNQIIILCMFLTTLLYINNSAHPNTHSIFFLNFVFSFFTKYFCGELQELQLDSEFQCFQQFVQVQRASHNFAGSLARIFFCYILYSILNIVHLCSVVNLLSDSQNTTHLQCDIHNVHDIILLC